ncbi:hypothetical protein WA026_000467 [Henosepilachna vigintioctopunctata]|uniref:Uncharacterized protein n=1 Tax=Henosepilachna vigintioctopunctata TaxID=420089 RepID=A0AAW1V5V6_9CUCU
MVITKSIQINSILSVFTVNLLAIACGNAYAWSSTVLISLKSDDTSVNPVGRPVNTFEESWITSLISLGASVGCFLSAYCSDKRLPAQ